MNKGNHKKVLVIIQARLSSTRLPGKVIREIGDTNETIISCQLKRLRKLKDLDIELCVATSLDETDNELVDYLNEHFPDVVVFRGSLNNVLDRYYKCALELNGDIIVRLTADCPFSDANLITQMLDEFKSKDLEYLSNTMPPEKSTFSDGFDVEIFKFEILEQCNKELLSDLDREHVTFQMWKSGRFRTDVFMNDNDVKTRIKLSVDYEDDFNLLTVLINKIGLDLNYHQIDTYIIENELFKLNDSNKINAGWQIK
jgi:spore coat polysaccharide biosynthesis protein SpsF